MSRTHKTRPLMVKAADPKDHSVLLVEEHDHREGDCDLPARPPRKLADLRAQLRAGTRCRYVWEPTGNARLCGCRMCTMHDYFKAERRKDRREAKRRLRAGTLE